MPGKNYLTKKALQQKGREAGLSTSGNRKDMLKRLKAQNSDDEYISAENQSLQKKVVELEKTVRELQERSFHPSVISSPIEKSATVNLRFLPACDRSLLCHPGKQMREVTSRGQLLSPKLAETLPTPSEVQTETDLCLVP